MPKRFTFFLSGVILLFLFIFFSFLVHKNTFTHLDFNTTVHLQDHISRRFDLPFSILSSIGQFEFMGVILAAIFLVFRRIKAGIIAFCFFVGFHLIEIFGKYFVHHPPPPQFMVRTYNIMQLPQYYVQNLNSYPSGHAGRTLFVTMIALPLVWQSRNIGFMMKILISCFILVFDITMLVSRVYLGEHWLSDIIGGSILGSSLGLFSSVFLLNSTHHTEHSEKKKGFLPKFKIEVKRVE
jgi:membrane-associated phospholipid phosphatase